MAQSIVHRGPDDEGFHIDGEIGLGFRRLSIIDLDGGHQPMCDPQQQIWVVFNGEIYNFPDLRDELAAAGYVFRTKSDTEVIVHGYREWGVDVLNHLNGMFGLAIWDTQEKRLLVARDPMGIKIIYYRLTSESVEFGSEIRPLLTNRQAPEVDPEAINLFLRYRYTPAPMTPFKGIEKLAPGTRLLVSNGKAQIDRWWLDAPQPMTPMPSIRDAEEQLLDVYRRAVKRQLISDVPLGLMLSGGQDSGLLLGLMGQRSEPWKTYTVGYGTSFKEDELTDAAITAQILKAKNFAVEINRESFENTLTKVVSVLEEPVASSSVVPMYHLCQRARQDVKVALMGQGPDELLGGYRRHLGVRYGAYWRALPAVARSAITGILSALPRNETLKRALYSLDEPDRMQRYKQVFSILSETRVNELFQEGQISDHCGDRILACWRDLEPLMGGTDELGGFQFLEVRSSLPDELMMYADKISMSHSLEIRVPFLDLEVVRYIERLSANLKVRNGRGKWLHARVCRHFLPQEIVNRPKRGFAVNVVDAWYRSALQGKTGDMLRDPQSYLYKYLRQEPVIRLMAEHECGRHDNHKILFSLVVLEEWLRSGLVQQC